MKSLTAKVGLAVVFPLLFFVLLESGLRLGGFGVTSDFFVPDEQPGVYRTNPHFTELFFPASFGLKPVNFRLSREKPTGAQRIFVIGESAAMGVPEPAFSITPQLQAQLRAADHGRQIDVYNLGVTAINSHAILRIVQEAVSFHPDLLVIYMGNNEVVGPYGPGSLATGRIPSRYLIRFGLWVRSTRTGQCVQRALAALRPAGTRFKDWRGMEMFARNAVDASDPRLADVYANFTANVDDMLAVAREAGVKIVLSTVAVNVRDCAPFVSRHEPGLAPAQLELWQQDIDRAALAVDRGKPDEARPQLDHALSINPRHADTHFRMARILEATGEWVNARKHYLDALQWDALRFRADAEINAIIRRAAAAHSSTVTLVDAAGALGSDADSSGPPAGAELFFEHVHLRWEGNYALTRLLAPAAWTALHEGSTAAPTWLDAAACADVVGYTDLGRLEMARDMGELTSRPPFTAQSSYGEARTRLLVEIATTESGLKANGGIDAAVAKVEAALRNDPKNPSLLFLAARARAQSGDLSAALALNEQLALVSPFAPEQTAQRAFLLQHLGRADEATELLLHSADSAPYYFQTYGVLAQLWIATEQLDRAREYFRKLVERMPDSRGARNFYAKLLVQRGDWAAAEQQWRAALQIVPDDESALEPLIKHLRKNGQADQAFQFMLAAFAYNPRSFENNLRLVQACRTKGDVAGTVKYLQALAASGPVNARLYFDLAQDLAKLGRYTETRAALSRAQRLAQAEGNAVVARSVAEMLAALANQAPND